MEVTINIPGNNTEVILKKIALQKLADTLDKENLDFLANVTSNRSNVNEKFKSKHKFIKTFL